MISQSDSKRISKPGFFNKAFEKFRRNSVDFFPRFKWFLLFFFIGLILDAYSTVYFMRHSGVRAELHPVVVFFSQHFGIYLGPFMGAAFKAIFAIMIAIYFRSLAHYLFLTASAIYFWAAWYSIWGVSLYTPYFLTLFE